MADLSVAKRVVDTIQTTMGYQSGPDGAPLRWFYCFGTMLEYVADRTFSLDFDIDIGVFFDGTNWESLSAAWRDAGFQSRNTIVDDRTGLPLNMHLENKSRQIPECPTIDVFAMVKRKGEFLYTYDIRREGKERPSKYEFKAVPAWMLQPTPDIIDRIRGRSHPEASRLLDSAGIWHYDVFEDNGPYKMQIPFAYGSLCDLWYPGWRFRKYYRGQSVSEKMVVVKSCKELDNGV